MGQVHSGARRGQRRFRLERHATLRTGHAASTRESSGHMGQIVNRARNYARWYRGRWSGLLLWLAGNAGRGSANGYDRARSHAPGLVVWRKILLWISLEFLGTSLAAEVIELAIVLHTGRRFRGIDAHPADRVAIDFAGGADLRGSIGRHVTGLVRSRQIFAGIGDKLVHASRRAEVVGLAQVLRPTARLRWIDGHAANGIAEGRGYL